MRYQTWNYYLPNDREGYSRLGFFEQDCIGIGMAAQNAHSLTIRRLLGIEVRDLAPH